MNNKTMSISLLVKALMLFACSAHAQGVDFSKVEIKTTDLGNKTYMLQGFGGNITVAAGDDGVIMVDSEVAPLHDKIKAAVEKISSQPVRYVINTNYRNRHTGGNESFRQDGAIIMAQNNVRARLASGIPPAPWTALPTDTYLSGSRLLKNSGRAALIGYAPNAVTDGDSWVYIPDANVLATGDTFNNTGRYPTIDLVNGGGIEGMIRASQTYLNLSNDNTKIVPGHGAVATKANLAEFHTMLLASRDRMKRLVDEGKSEGDVVAGKPFADLDAKWAADEQGSANWTRLVYRSVNEQPLQHPVYAAVDPRTLPFTCPRLRFGELGSDCPTLDTAIRNCDNRLRGRLIERTDRRDVAASMLRVEILTVGDLVYRINLRGISIFLSNRSTGFWENISFTAMFTRPYRAASRLQVTVFPINSQKTMISGEVEPANVGKWDDISNNEIEDLRDFVANELQSCGG